MPISRVFYQIIFQTRLHTDRITGRNTKWALLDKLTQTRLSQIQVCRMCLIWKRLFALLKALSDSFKNSGSVGAFFKTFWSVCKVKGHKFKMLFNLNNNKLIPYLDGLFLMPSDVSINVISPIYRCGIKFLLINCKFPMTSVTYAAWSKKSIYGDMLPVCKISRLYS